MIFLHKTKYRIFFILLFITSIVIYNKFMVRDPYFESRNPYFDGNGSILIWTDYLGSPNWGYYDANFQIEGQVDCKEKCYVTRDKSYLEKVICRFIFTIETLIWEICPRKKSKAKSGYCILLNHPIFHFTFILMIQLKI